MMGGKAQPASLTEVGVEVAAGNPPESGDEVPQAAVGAVLQQPPVPGIVQLHDPGHIPPGLLQLPCHSPELGNPILGKVRNQAEGERLQHRQDTADVPEILAGKGPKPEPTAGIGVQDPLTGETDERLPHRRSADAKLYGQCRVLDPAPWSHVPSFDAGEDFPVDLLAERGS